MFRTGLHSRLALSIVALVGLAQRALVFARHRAALDALAQANPDWYTGQQLPPEMLRDHLFRSMLLLQQTPPVPNLMMGAAVKWFSLPGGVAAALVLLQGVLSVAAAVLMARMLLTLYPGRVALAAGAGIAFVLGGDLVVIEYNSFGQTFYEIVSMLLALGLAAALLAVHRGGKTLPTVAAGALVALLALTRASWSFFALPGLALVLALARSDRARHAALFLAPVLVLHGGWAVKNWAVYGRLTPVTSTWTGWNLVNGIRGAGFGDSFRAFVLSRPDLRCFAIDLGKGGPPLDERAGEADRRVEERIGLPNPRFNTLAMRDVLDDCGHAFWQFARQSPRLVAEKTLHAYRRFWLPAANYGRFFLGLFAVENRLDRGLDPLRIAELLWTGELPDQPLERSGKFPKRNFAPTSLYTVRWLEPLTLLANIAGVHVLLPLALAGGAILRRRRLGLAALVIFATCYGYLALVSSVGDYGENMRFRVGVEPLIWLITIVSAAELASLAAGHRLCGGSPSIDTPAGSAAGRS